MQRYDALIHKDLRTGAPAPGRCVVVGAEGVVYQMIVALRHVQLPDLGLTHETNRMDSW